jgi:hypothetical protein
MYKCHNVLSMIARRALLTELCVLLRTVAPASCTLFLENESIKLSHISVLLLLLLLLLLTFNNGQQR